MSDKALLIIGPTGTGKSLLALELALKLKTAIVNVDSVQVFRDLVIGSAQPSKDDFKIAPHYLYGYLPAGATITASSYCEDVRELMATKLTKGPYIFCGGSGFYIQALEKGMFPVPTLTEEEKQKVQAQIAEWGWVRSYHELLKQDPKASEKIHENDHYRIQRALEIIITTGKKPTDISAQSHTSPLYGKSIIKIGLDLDKDKLRERIHKRTLQMLSAGWLEEVEALLQAGHRDWSALKSVGYLEVVEYLDGKTSHPEMIEKIVTSNMQLIKKQRTWFKRDPEIKWFSSEEINKAAQSVLAQF